MNSASIHDECLLYISDTSLHEEPSSSISRLDSTRTYNPEQDKFSWHDYVSDEETPIPIRNSPKYQAKIVEWIRACNDMHGETCVPDPISRRPPDDIPRWLIDTTQHCIVPGLSAHQYLALSYVWPETRGSSDSTSLVPPRTLLLNNESMTDFQCPGFLSNEDVSSRIPGIIKHAMQLTQDLGEQYLWVDRLCIVQDDVGDGGTLSQVAKMDKIYAGAYLTIIAAAHEEMYEKVASKHWFPFMSAKFSSDQRRRYEARNRHERKYGLPLTDPRKEEIMQIMSCRYESLSKSRWATRGWTYQEQILCRRAVMFTSDGFFWDCQCSMWDGVDLFPGSDFDGIALRTDRGHRFTTRWWPDFGFYLDLICPYNGREFSYSQDAMLGMLGIFNALAPAFPGGFVHGLPRLFLDHALLWQPFGTTERRIDRRDDEVLCSSLPSWSWAGWQCYVDPWSLRSGLSYVLVDEYRKRGASWRTRNLVEWTLCANNGLETKVLEPTILDRCIAEKLIKQQSHSEEWVKHIYHGDNADEGIIAQGPLFSHSQHPDLCFEHPIPIQEKTAHPSNISTPTYLVCNTTSAFFSPATILKSTRYHKSYAYGESKISVFDDKIFKLGPKEGCANPILVLQQSNGAFAGLLRLMTQENDVDETSSVELIAISTGSAKARDLRRSLEWRVFETAQDSYSDDMVGAHFDFEPAFISASGKPALLFDLAMAFDPEAASHEPLGEEFTDACNTITRRCEDWIDSRRENLRKLVVEHPRYEDWVKEQLQVRPEDWFRDRNRFLQEQLRSTVVEQKGFRVQWAGLPVRGSAASSRWAVVRKMILNGSFFEAWDSCEEGMRLGDLDEMLCEWYNVLWIERIDGVAYRKACGWVPKYIWEANHGSKTEIKLG